MDAASAIFAQIPTSFQNYPPIKEIFDGIQQKKTDKNVLSNKLTGDTNKAIGLANNCKYDEAILLLENIIKEDPFKGTSKELTSPKQWLGEFKKSKNLIEALIKKARDDISQNDYKSAYQNAYTANSINKNCSESAELLSISEKKKNQITKSNGSVYQPPEPNKFSSKYSTTQSNVVPVVPIAPTQTQSNVVPIVPIAPTQTQSNALPIVPIAPTQTQSNVVPIVPIAPTQTQSNVVPIYQSPVITQNTVKTSTDSHTRNTSTSTKPPSTTTKVSCNRGDLDEHVVSQYHKLPKTITIYATNETNKNVHLYTDSEQIGPANLVTPGSTRTITHRFNEVSYAYLQVGLNGRRENGYPIYSGNVNDQDKVLVTYDNRGALNGFICLNSDAPSPPKTISTPGCPSDNMCSSHQGDVDQSFNGTKTLYIWVENNDIYNIMVEQDQKQYTISPGKAVKLTTTFNPKQWKAITIIRNNQPNKHSLYYYHYNNQETIKIKLYANKSDDYLYCKGNFGNSSSPKTQVFSSKPITNNSKTWNSPPANFNRTTNNKLILGSWKVGAIVNGQRQSPHPAPWVFSSNGTVEASGYWKGTWHDSGNNVSMKINNDGTSPGYNIAVDSGGNNFIAYENGKAFRYGIRLNKSSSNNTSSKNTSTTGGYIYLQSINYPDYIIRHSNFLGEISTISSIVNKADAAFRMVPGLKDSRYISFESVNNPGYYLRHQNFRIKLQPRAGDDLYLKDTTFKIVPGLANSSWSSFESYNYPGYYIRHRDSHLYLESGNSDLFRKDTTFKIIKP